MQRFSPSSRPETLSNKVISTIHDLRFMPPTGRKRPLQVVPVLGMDAEVRAAMARLLAWGENHKIGVFGEFMPDDGVSALLAERGIPQKLEEADFFRVRRVAIPYCGISARVRRAWEEAVIHTEDFTSAQVRRAQISLGLLRIEGAQTLLIGRHEDPESLAIAGGTCTKIIEDTTDTARLVFSPAFGVVCQSTLSPRRISWLAQQLRMRYRDARVTFLETISPSMMRREEALEKELVSCDRVVVVGRSGEATSEALVETAQRRGKMAVIVRGLQDLEKVDCTGNPRIALTAGGFALDATIRAVAEGLLSR